jgi:hypothetical protein
MAKIYKDRRDEQDALLAFILSILSVPGCRTFVSNFYPNKISDYNNSWVITAFNLKNYHIDTENLG